MSLQARLMRAERSASAKVRNDVEFIFRVSGKTQEQARRDLADIIRQAASRPGVADDIKAKCEAAIARIETALTRNRSAG